jgi:prepilin-type N-terminal cleavage/methylation domain-containing protein
MCCSLIQKKRASGFTLAELLIALAILGVIATFTIPKILTAQQNSQKNAAAHEVISALAGAFQLVQQANPISTSTNGDSFMTYLNYVALDTSSALDDVPGANVSWVCGSNVTCYKMHAGGTLFYRPADHYYGTASPYAMTFFYDPDGVRTGVNTDGPGKTIVLYLYANGRITSWGQCLSGTIEGNNSTRNPDPANDPSWFSW